MTSVTVTKGSGNVFRDLGFSEEKSAELILKSSLLQALQETIKDRGWKQVEAAAQLGIDQAKVSKLLAGQMAGFSIERLVNFLSLLGQDVEVTVRKAVRQGCWVACGNFMRERVSDALLPHKKRSRPNNLCQFLPAIVAQPPAL
jgi:predicted XRE-type DNA-binding protein